MKYGQTLKQRSIREWGHYNLDYDEIKNVIKENTSPGKGKAVSIPGQGNVSERDFERLLFELLRDQHLRIELFVKSKHGEIERRLDHLSRQIRIFRLRVVPETAKEIPVRHLEKYARIESEVLRAGQEVRSLSRFVGAQRMGFTKLLKKYRKWTNSSTLGEKFRADVLEQSMALSKHSLDGLLEHWAEVLHAFRTPFQTKSSKDDAFGRFSGSMSNAIGRSSSNAQFSSSIIQHMHFAVNSQSDVDYDSAFVTLPIGDMGNKAVYWIHPDQVVEITVLLLQYLRLHSTNDRPGTASSSAPASRRSSLSRNASSRHGSFSQGQPQPDMGLDAGLIILDDIDDFAQKQSSSTITEIQHPASGSKAPNGRIRWTNRSEAVVILKAVQGRAPEAACGYQASRIKRKHVNDFLSREEPFSVRRSSSALDNAESLETQQRSHEAVQDSRSWLENHRNTGALATICSKRTRFLGLSNNETRGQWAVLDQNIHTTAAPPTQLADSDWSAFYRHAGTRFPYVVLQVRQEGPLAMDLIDLLDRSYLTERVRGFSLEAQAVWACCKPSKMAPPSWVPLLSRDIRKLPTKDPPHRHQSVIAFPRREEPATQSPDSATTTTAGDLSSSTGGGAMASSSATSYQASAEAEQIASPAKAKRKAKRARLHLPTETSKVNSHSTGYWNEYDFPEDEEGNDTYVLYIDPNAPLGYPGQAAIEKVISWITAPFKPATDEERRMLLSPSSEEASPTDSTAGNGDDEESSSDENDSRIRQKSYGTIPLPATTPASHDQSWLSRLGPLSRLFGSRRRKARRSSRPMDPFTAELEQQFHARESSKLRTCLTSLAASVAILVVVFILAATGRRKQRGTVDEGVLFGIVASLLFATVGVGYLLSLSWDGFDGQDKGKDGVLSTKWLMRGVVALVFIGVCVADGSLIAWMVA